MTWGQWASSEAHQRYMQPTKTRRHCWCGCKQRATHSGFANGMCLTAPVCELAGRRWVKFGWVKRPVGQSTIDTEETK